MNKPMLTALFLGASVTGITACAMGKTNTVPLQANKKIPSAEGTAMVQENEDGNKVVDVKVKHLAKPSKASPGSAAYVVWLKPLDKEAPIQNAGVLTVNSNLDGELKTVTSFNDFDVFVTAETDGSVTKPSGTKMLTARVMRHGQ